MNGSKKINFEYDTPDGLITVRINGGDNTRTEWYFKVNCPTPAKSSTTKKTTK